MHAEAPSTQSIVLNMINYNEKLQFLEQLLGSAKYSHNSQEALFRCPFCNHHKKKLSINLETDRWQCFPCGKNGKRLFYVLKQVGTREDLETYDRLYKSKQVIDKTPHYQDLEFRLRLPDEFSPIINCKNSVFGKRAFSWLTEERGLTEQDILCHKLGIMTSGEQMGDVVISSFDARGLLNWYQTRRIGGSYWNPKVPYGYKNQIIPNDLNIDWSEPIVIVEGAFDCYKSIRNTIPLFGSFLSSDSVLFKKIVRNEVPVFLALDADAVDKRNKIAKSLMRNDIVVYNVDVSPFGDVGQMSKKDFRERYDSATLLDDNAIFRERLRAVC